MSLITKAFGTFCAIAWAFLVAGVLLAWLVDPEAAAIAVAGLIWVIASTPAFLVLWREDKKGDQQ